MEWRRFFADSSAVSQTLVDNFVNQHKKNKFLKQSLRRLIHKGFIREKSKKLLLTKAGADFFESNVRKPFEKNSWDGKWYLLSFDIPVDLNVKRDRLRRVLKSYNFYPLQKSVWVGPNKFGSDLWEFVVENDIDKFCKVMIVDVIEGDEDIKRHFGLV